MTALRRAVALTEPDDIAVGVGEDLHLDVARAREVALEVALGAAEVRLRLTRRGHERVGCLVGVGGDLQSLAAAAVRGLDRDRPSELVAERDDLGGVTDRLERARHRRDVGGGRRLPRRDLVAHDLDRLRGRPDPRDAPRGDRAGEVGVLGEEPVPGMHRLRAALLDRAEDGVGVQVALGRGLPAQGVRLVGVPDVQRIPVEVGVDGDGGDTELAAGAHHPHCDLTPVGDQNFSEHGFLGLRRTNAVSYGGVGTDLDLDDSSFRRAGLHQSPPARRGAARVRPRAVVAVADHQTAGRGRLDRRWEAPPGSSLLVSVLLRPALDPEGAHRVVMAAALALADAVGAVAGFTPDFKWPNDLVVGERKLAGLLAEREPGSDDVRPAVIVGAGVNVNWTEFPPELAEHATACNLEAGRAVDRDALLDEYLERLGRRLDALDSVPSDYRARLVTIGRRVRVEQAGGTITGAAVDVRDAGELVVRDDDGAAHVITTADVIHLRSD